MRHGTCPSLYMKKITLYWGSPHNQLGQSAPRRMPMQSSGSSGTGWPQCLQALATTVILAREAGKLTLGPNVNAKVPHPVTALMKRAHKCLANSRMIHYQELLCKNPRVQLETVRTLNPTTFFLRNRNPCHNCEELIGGIYSSRLHLMDIPF